VNLTAGVCFISFDDMHYNHVAHKDNTQDCIENEFGCHCDAMTQIDFDYLFELILKIPNQFL